jgi:uncharacterized protein (DUF58 family)
VRSALVIPLGRQGPGRLPPAVIARLEHQLRRRAAATLPGDHLTPGAGDGMELAQLRPYEPGDDVRRLDPAASARTGEPHVRLQVPERAVTTWLVLDVSPSMAFGTQGRLKSDVAEGVAEVVGRVGVRRGGRVALVVAGGDEPRVVPPRPGRAALASLRAVIHEGVVADAATQRGGRRLQAVDANPAEPSPRPSLAERAASVRRAHADPVKASPRPSLAQRAASPRRAHADPEEASPRPSLAERSALPRRAHAESEGPGPRSSGAKRPSDGRFAPGTTVGREQPSPLAAALTRVARLARSTGVVVVVSDFCDEGWAAPLRACSARHTVLAVEITDPAEAALPAAGLLTLVDPESGQVVEADTSAPQLRDAYAAAESARRAAVAAAVRGARADHLALSTERDWLRDLGRRMS